MLPFPPRSSFQAYFRERFFYLFIYFYFFLQIPKDLMQELRSNIFI